MRSIFRRFEQADSGFHRSYEGTGLGNNSSAHFYPYLLTNFVFVTGLTICTKLIELMMGRIGVRSEQGKGSTFWYCTFFPFSSTKFNPIYGRFEIPLQRREDDEMEEQKKSEVRVNQIGVLQSVLGVDVESSSEDEEDEEEEGRGTTPTSSNTHRKEQEREKTANEEVRTARKEREARSAQRAIERAKRKEMARFLIVQKSKSSCCAISELLQHWGFRSIATTSAFEALEIIAPGINAEYARRPGPRDPDSESLMEGPNPVGEDRVDLEIPGDSFSPPKAHKIEGGSHPPQHPQQHHLLPPPPRVRQRSISVERDHLLQEVSNEIESTLKDPPMSCVPMVDPKDRESASIKIIIVDYDLIGMNALQFGQRVCYLNERRGPSDKFKMILTVNVGVPLPKAAPAWGFGITSTYSHNFEFMNFTN